jgi:hypothetical protein
MADLVDIELFPPMRRTAATLATDLKAEQTLDATANAVVMRFNDSDFPDSVHEFDQTLVGNRTHEILIHRLTVLRSWAFLCSRSGERPDLRRRSLGAESTYRRVFFEGICASSKSGSVRVATFRRTIAWHGALARSISCNNGSRHSFASHSKSWRPVRRPTGETLRDRISAQKRKTIDLPEDVSTALKGRWDDVQRRSLEVIAVEGYRIGALTETQVRRLLQFETRFQVHALLKEHLVPLRYTEADLEEDLRAHREVGVLPGR